MANIGIGFPNHAGRAGVVISGGRWSYGLPATNLLDPIIRKVARSFSRHTDDARFMLALDRPRDVGLVALVGNNFSSSAHFKVEASNDAGFATLVYASTGGFQDVYPPLFRTKDLSWSSPNWWSGRALSEDLAGFIATAIHVLPRTINARYWRVIIDDATNPLGYVEVGRLFLSSLYRPSINYAYGGSLGVETGTGIEESLGGTEFFERRTPYRVMRFGFDNLPEREAFSQALEIQRRAGLDAEVFIVPDTDDTLNLLRRSFLGRNRALSALEQAVYDHAAIQFEVKELL